MVIFQVHWKAVHDMKEFRFNWKYLLKKNEFWAAVFIVLAINVFAAGVSIFTYDSNFAMTMTADYQFVLNNVYVNMLAAVILIIPVALGLVFSDADWLEEKRRTDILLYARIDHRKNIVVRFVMSVGVSVCTGFTIQYDRVSGYHYKQPMAVISFCGCCCRSSGCIHHAWFVVGFVLCHFFLYSPPVSCGNLSYAVSYPAVI